MLAFIHKQVKKPVRPGIQPRSAGFYDSVILKNKEDMAVKRILMILPVLLLLTGCAGKAQKPEGSVSSAAPAASAVSSGTVSSAASAADVPSAEAASSEAKTEESISKSQENEDPGRLNEIWVKEEMPESVRYDRQWVYSAYGETKDPEVLKELVDAVRALEIGEKSEWITEDYTDILTFTFADGDTLRLEFEDQCWVKADDERYEVTGLDQVRTILEAILPETQ